MKRLTFLTVTLLLTIATIVGFSQDDKTVLLFMCEAIKGDTVEDLSGNGNDGKINGNIKVVEGRWNNGYQLDGKSHILVSKSDTLAIKTNITVELWMKREPSDAEQFIIDKRDGGGYEMYINSNIMRFLMETPALKIRLDDPETAPIGEWHYYAGTYDGKKMKLYVDGELVAEGEQKDDLGIESDLFIGGENGTSGFFKGILDNLRISNVARTKNELKDAFERGFLAVEPSGKLTTTWSRVKNR